jgi:hypothetical protein
MDRPNLRPVPSRPPGSVQPSDALRHVAAELPGLDQSAVAALALVDLAGRTRAEAAVEGGVAPGDLGPALARARTALRRALHPLPGSGWCGRAERLLSDRLDGELDPRGDKVLDVHLDNCPRCVDHDRRLAQAQDGLVQRFVEAYGLDAPAEPAAADAPVLRVVEEETAPPPGANSPPAEPPATREPGARPLFSSVADAGGRVWVSAAGLAVALTILSVLIVILGALGASITF